MDQVTNRWGVSASLVVQACNDLTWHDHVDLDTLKVSLGPGRSRFTKRLGRRRPFFTDNMTLGQVNISQVPKPQVDISTSPHGALSEPKLLGLSGICPVLWRCVNPPWPSMLNVSALKLIFLNYSTLFGCIWFFTTSARNRGSLRPSPNPFRGLALRASIKQPFGIKGEKQHRKLQFYFRLHFWRF